MLQINSAIQVELAREFPVEPQVPVKLVFKRQKLHSFYTTLCALLLQTQI